jgi:hypothetical protein
MLSSLLRIALITVGGGLLVLLIFFNKVELAADPITGTTRQTVLRWGVPTSDVIVWQSPLDTAFYSPETALKDRVWKTYTHITQLGSFVYSRGCSKCPKAVNVRSLDEEEMAALLATFREAVDHKAGPQELQALVEHSLR